MPAYTVFKVNSIDRVNHIITGEYVTGSLVPVVGATIKATFIKATDIEVAQTGNTPTMEIDFNYRNKF